MNFTLPWRTVALGATCVSLGLVAVLAVVVRQGVADYLATLALALAVIAFIVQIVVFIGQSAAASLQLARAEELHGLTSRALAAIEEKSEGTRREVTTLNERVLQAALGKVLPRAEAAGVSPDSPAVVAEVLGLLRRQSGTGGGQAEASGPPTATRSRGTTRSTAPLKLPNSSDLQAVAESLSSLDGDALSSLETLARDYQKYGVDDGIGIGHGVEGISEGRQLFDAGLARKVRVGWEENPVWILTDKGKEAAALLTRRHLSDEAMPLVSEARAKLHEHHANVARLLGRYADDGIPVDDQA